MSAAAAVAAVRTGDGAPLGAVVGLSLDGGVDVATSGSADLAGTPVTADTAFDLASVSKVVGTTCVLHRLAAAGELAFDDDVSRYLPSSPCAPGTTVRSLLQHRAGLWEWQPLYFTPDADAALDALPLRYPPQTARHYSDLGFLLLGRLVAAVAASELPAAVSDLLLRPLGLHRTGFGPVTGQVASSAPGDDAERRMVATGEPYPVELPDPGFAWRETEINGVAHDGNCFHAFGGVAGHAGLFSTAADLLALGAALAADDLDASWGRTASREVFADGPDRGQALGWRSARVRHRGEQQRLLWHGGYTGTALGFLPGAGLAVVLLSNRLFADRVASVDSLWARALDAVGDLTRTPETGA